MTSQAQALEPLANVRGLIFFGFPLHPAGAPGIERAAHLDDVKIPMLFLSGTNDALAELKLLKKVTTRLGKRAALELAQHADHSFHVAAKTGLKDADILAALLDTAAAWMLTHA
jgi:predicted alpha/beta-hydrolase family hydrolase